MAYFTSDATIGDRIQLSPATDAWMRGDRYGEIVKVTRQNFHVKMDKSGRTLRVSRNQQVQVID